MNEKQQRSDCQPEPQMLKGFDPVQEYADKIRAGARCENCVNLGSSYCNTCNHYELYVSYADMLAE